MSQETNAQLFAFFFLDLVGSTTLNQKLRDVEYAAGVWGPFTSRINELLESFDGASGVDNAGDGYFITFPTASDAVKFALLLHDPGKMPEIDGEACKTRIGIHVGEAVLHREPVTGQIKPVGIAQGIAARVMGLAVGGQTLLTEFAKDNAYQSGIVTKDEGGKAVEWRNWGEYRLKRIDRPQIIHEVGIAGIAPFKEPPGSVKALWFRFITLLTLFVFAFSALAVLVIFNERAHRARVERALGAARNEFERAEENLRIAKRERDSAIASRKLAEQEAANTQSVLAFLDKAFLNAARPLGQEGGLGIDISLRESLDKAETQISATFGAQPLLEGKVRRTFGLTYLSLGEPQLAVSQLERSLHLLSTNLDESHLDTLLVSHDLGVAYRANGQSDAALRIHQDNRSKLESLLGESHPTTLVSMNDLALALEDSGKLDEALAMHQEVLKRRKSLSDQNPAEILATESNIGGLYSKLGRHPLAVPLLKNVLEQRTATLSERHPDILLSMNNLALAYKLSGRLDLALPLYEEALKHRRSVLGDNHPHTLNSMFNLGRAYLVQVETKPQAVPLFAEGVTRRKAKFGLQHADTLAVMTVLAKTYREIGKTAEAIQLFTEVLDLRVVTLGEAHPLTLETMHNLAGAHLAAKNFSEGIRLHERQVTFLRSMEKGNEQDLLSAIHGLALAYKLAGKSELAVPLYEEVLEGRKKLLGPQDANTLRVMYNLALAYQAMGRHDRSIPLLQESLIGQRKIFVAGHAEILLTVENLALAYEQANRLPEAETLHGELVAFWRAKEGLDSHRYSFYLSKLADNQLQQEKYDLARPLLQEALSLQEKSRPNSWVTFNLRSLLGGALAGQKEFAAAEVLLLSGYQGMQERESKMQVFDKIRLLQAAERVEKLYIALQNKEEVQKWRNVCAEYAKKLSAVIPVDEPEP